MNLYELYDYAVDQGIDVDWYTMPFTKSFSIFIPSLDRRAIALAPWKFETVADEFTTLGHEVGHCMTYSFYNRWAAYDIKKKHENRADKWAIQHLIPVEELDEAVADGYTDLPSLAEHFCVTVPLCARPSAGIPTVIWPWRCMLERPRWPCLNL